MIEIVSALASMVRERRATVNEFDEANFEFLKDVADGRIVVASFSKASVIACRDLLTMVGLRAGRSLKSQDAMVALTAKQLALENGERVRLYTSDRRLASVVSDLALFAGLVEAVFLRP